MKNWIAVLLAAGIFFFCGCENQFVKDSSFKRSGETGEAARGKRNISLVCWNVQTFFDAVTTGSEEFRAVDERKIPAASE